MQKLLAAALSIAFVVSVGGCMHDKDNDMDHDDMNMKHESGTSSSSKGMNSPGADQCSHCPGVQTLNADGTCPECHMKMK